MQFHVVKPPASPAVSSHVQEQLITCAVKMVEDNNKINKATISSALNNAYCQGINQGKAMSSQQNSKCACCSGSTPSSENPYQKAFEKYHSLISENVDSEMVPNAAGDGVVSGVISGSKGKILVLTCIDYRFVTPVYVGENLLDNGAYADYFDIFVFAGAGLGYLTSLGYTSEGTQFKKSSPSTAWPTLADFPWKDNTTRTPDKTDNYLKTWRNVFETHIKLAVTLHDIKEIHIIDHEDCGAYNAWFGSDLYPRQPTDPTTKKVTESTFDKDIYNKQLKQHKFVLHHVESLLEDFVENNPKIAGKDNTINEIRGFLITNEWNPAPLLNEF
jgi:hypothetical protein